MFVFKHRLIGPPEYIMRHFQVGAGQTIQAGQLVTLSSGKVVAATSGATSILGVALGGLTTGASPTASDVVPVHIPLDSVFEVDFLTNGTKTSFTDADIGTAFDCDATGMYLDPDVTTTGFLVLYSYDNSRAKAFVLIRNQILTPWVYPSGSSGGGE